MTRLICTPVISKGPMRVAYTYTLIVALLQAFPLSAQTVRVSGTSVALAPPAGFSPSERFPGFERADLQASIMVTEIAAPVAVLTRGMTAAGVASRGMTLISSTRLHVDGSPALMLHLAQSASGSAFLKWMIVAGVAKGSVIIVATFPKSAEPELSAPLKASLLSTRWGVTAAPDHFEGLPFRISGTPLLKIAGRLSNMLMLTESGTMGPHGPDAALLAIGSSIAPVRIDDLKAFAAARASETKQLKDIRISQQGATTIDGVAADEIVAEGTDRTTGTKVALYQVILPDRGGYILMQGMVSPARASVMVPEFRRVAATFRRLKR
ncbi:MAG: hypothetical protein ABIP65_09330 [Vicinamibacterales bacterium]